MVQWPVQWFNGSIVQWFNSRLNGSMAGSMVQWFNGRFNGSMTSSMVQWMAGSIVQWPVQLFTGRFNGSMAGSMVQWTAGSMVQWPAQWFNGRLNGSMDFCLEPCIVVVRGGFLSGSIQKSVGSYPGRKSVCGEPPAKHVTGLFSFCLSGTLYTGLSGPLWASASQPASPASQLASQAHDRFPGRT